MVSSIRNQNNIDRVSNSSNQIPFFLKNLHLFLPTQLTERHLALKDQVRISKSPETWIPIKIFNKTFLKPSTLQEFYKALNANDLELIFTIIDSQRFTKDELEEIELAIASRHWAKPLININFLKLMVLIQFTLNPHSNKIIESLHLKKLPRRDSESIHKYYTSLFNPLKAITGNHLTEEDMQKIDDSSFLRNFLYRNPKFVNLMAESRVEIKWFEKVYKESPLSFGSILLEKVAVEDKNFALIDILARTKDRHFTAKLLSLEFPSPFKEMIVPKLNQKSLLLFGHDSSLTHYFLGTTAPKELMGNYLKNPQFNLKSFFLLFPPPYGNLTHYENAHEIMKYRPEIMAKLLKDNSSLIDLDRKEIYFDMHMDRPQPTAQFNLDLVEFCFPGDPRPNVVHDLFHFKNYQEGDIQRLIQKYPLLREDIFNYADDLNEILPVVIQDVIRLFLEDFENREDILPAVLGNISLSSLIKLIPSNLSFEKITKRNKQESTLLELTHITELAPEERDRLLSLGKFSDLFNCTKFLFDFLRYNPEIFEEYLAKEEHLFRYFQEPYRYKKPKPNAPTLNLSSASLFPWLTYYPGDAIDRFMERGFIFDPLDKDVDGNTFFHVHPDFKKGIENAVHIPNNFDQTPLWNPSHSIVLACLQHGADPKKKSSNGSIFLHSFRVKSIESLEVIKWIKEKSDFQRLLLQTNNKGETVLEKLLEVERPFFLSTLQSLDLTPTLQTNAIILNQIIRSEDTYRENERSISLSPELKQMKEVLLKEFLDNFENFHLSIHKYPFIFRTLLIQQPHLFSKEKLIQKLSNNPSLELVEWFFSQELDLSEYFKEWSADQRRKITPLLPPDQIKEIYQAQNFVSFDKTNIHRYINEIVNFLNTIESDWIAFFNTTQEELKKITSFGTAYLTLNKMDTILRLLPYFHSIQLAIIIPLLPPATLLNVLEPLPTAKKAEYLLFATTEQKQLFIQSFALIPKDFELWDKSVWLNRSLEEFAPKYQSLSINTGLKKLKEALFKNLKPEEILKLSPLFDAAEKRIAAVQSEIKEVLDSLQPQRVEIPEEFLDPFTYEELRNPIKIPLVGNEEPRWLSQESWIKYQREGQNYLTKVDKTESKVEEGSIRHPLLHTPVKIKDFQPDPHQAERLQRWKVSHNQ